MVFQPEQPVYDVGIYELEITDPVQGGVGGVANEPLLSLANRTAYLKQQLDSLINGSLIPPTVAPLSGPAFVGSPTSPNVAPGDNSTKIANTNFVQTRHAGFVSVAVSGSTLTLNSSQWGVGIIEFTGVLTQAVAIQFPAQQSGTWTLYNATTGAFALSAQIPGNSQGPVIPQGGSLEVWTDGVRMYQSNTILTGRGEVTSADLAPTGVGAGNYSATNLQVGTDGRIIAASSGTIGTGGLTATGVNAGSYTKTNLTVGVDGRISAAASGVVSLSDVTGPAALNFTPVQQGTGVGQLGNVIKIGWSGTKLKATVDATDEGNIALESYVSANFLPVVNPSATGSLSATGNIVALTRLVASFGAFGSGNPNAAAILSDFLNASSGSDYFYIRLPNGQIVQGYDGVNSTGADTISFPVAFPTRCVQCLAHEAAPQGWGGTAPSIMGTQNLNAGNFALYVLKWGIVAGAWTYSGGISFRYIAMGY